MSVDLILPPKANTIDGFPVMRALPRIKCRSVGPFVFLDQMGPASFDAGRYLDVAPHPHIGLATITWLIEGEIRHRDSLGNDLVIRPGGVNWMTAGRGIVHSERSPENQRHAGSRIFGVQAWTALPKAHEETAPSFQHYPADGIPQISGPGTHATLIVGEGWDHVSPVSTVSETLYAQIDLQSGAEIALPPAPERAIYVMSGNVQVDGTEIGAAPVLAVLSPDAARITAEEDARLMLLGGAPLEAPRQMDWNFVASDRNRIETARADWIARRFPAVPGDNGYTPYPGTE